MASVPPKIEENDQQLLGWLSTAIQAGRSSIAKERAYQGIGGCIDYVAGNTGTLRPSALSKVSFNRIRKNVYEIVSSMTDVRPVWNYQTYNNEYKKQADILNLLVRNWWRNSHADKRMQDALMYSCVGGSGYLKIEWNPYLPGGGNIDLIPLDPRDVIPINPALNSSVQQWEGVAIRKTLPLETLRWRYPEKYYRYKAATKSWFDAKTGGTTPSPGQAAIISPVLERLFSGSQPSVGADVDLVSVFIRDNSMNTGLDPVLMGRPGTNWCYKVYPLGSINPITKMVVTEDEAKLYPRGRLIICTPETILEDIPNPYWHGLFPVVKFTLDPQPWSILGSSLVDDGRTMQDSLNEILRGVEDCVKQCLRRTAVADRNAISKSLLNKFDTRLAGQKLQINPTQGEGIKLLDGPELPAYVMEYVKFLIEGLDDNMGVKGLKELAQLKQMPSSDTIEKFMDAQSPILKLRGKGMEQSLAELAEMVKVMIFQYYDLPRRVQILGPDGASMQDFDYDPRQLVPALSPGDPGYKPEYDKNFSRVERAQRFHRNFTFAVAPGTLLDVTQTQQKMFQLQLFRMQMLDPWTLWEAFDVPNIGPVPPDPVPQRIRLAKMIGLIPPDQMMLMQMQGGQPPGGGPPPGGGKPPGQGEGRPPSGNQPPQMVQRKDENGIPRQAVSESGR